MSKPTGFIGFCILIKKLSVRLKTVIIMANIKLLFNCSEDKEACYVSCEERNGIIDVTILEGGRLNTVYLDKSTAIKFAKTLRTEINKIQC